MSNVNLLEFVKRYLDGNELPPNIKQVCAFLEEHPTARLQVNLTEPMKRFSGASTLQNPSPLSFLPEGWMDAVPRDALYLAEEHGDSVSIAHAQALTTQLYAEAYHYLSCRDFSKEEIQTIFLAAHTMRMDIGEAADLWRLTTRGFEEGKSSGFILVDDPPRPKQFHYEDLRKFAPTCPPIEGESSKGRKYVPPEKRFSRTIEQKMLEARRERLKNGIKRKRR